MTSPAVLITGAGGGLGSETCRLLLSKGWTVFAADLQAPDIPGAIPLVLDVTDDASVLAAVAQVAAASPALAGVVHFAGILRVGALMDFTAEALAGVLEVNVLGAHRVNRAVLPLLRQGNGRVVLISSETGVQSGAPFNGSYAMSKHAVEAYGDSLRRELMFLGVPVIKVQPGPFRTDMVSTVVARFEQAADNSPLFGDLLRSTLSQLPREQAKAHDPAVLAEVVLSALTARRWRSAYLVRADRGRRALDLLPPRVADGVIRLGIRALALQARRRR